MSKPQTVFDPNDPTLDGLSVMYKTYALTFQTLAFGEYVSSAHTTTLINFAIKGAYAALLPISTHILL